MRDYLNLLSEREFQMFEKAVNLFTLKQVRTADNAIVESRGDIYVEK